MTDLMAKEHHAPAFCFSFGFEHDLLFKGFQAGVREEEWYADYGLFVRTKPFVGQIAGRVEIDAGFGKFRIELGDTFFQPRAFNGQAETAKAHVEQLCIVQF